jgi:hypothetical protein
MFFAIFLSLLSIYTLAQDPCIANESKYICVDELENIYLVHSNYIERLSQNGKAYYRTSELSQGEITSFDITNPFKPFAYFRGTGKIIFFDNTLSRNSQELDLFTIGDEQIELVAGSRGDHLWFWDAGNSEVIRRDDQMRKKFSSGNLAVLLKRKIRPIQMIERGENLYMLTDESIIIFDMYGRYKTRFDVQSSTPLSYASGKIFYVENDTLKFIHEDLVSSGFLDEKYQKIRSFQIKENRLYILADGQFCVHNNIKIVNN